MNCPTPDELHRLLLGELSGETAEVLERHLGECARCAGTVTSLGVDDTLAEAVRAGAALAREAENAVNDDVLSRVAGLPSRPADPQETVDDATAESSSRANASSPAGEFACDFLEPAQAPDEIGRLGAYRVLRVLGHGGMGVVFLGEDTKLHRRVALKAMLPEIARRPEARARFLREARTAAAIEHDNLVPIYQVMDEEATVPFLAMPFLQGASLEDWLRPREKQGVPPTKPAQILKLGREVARGLAAAHGRGLIHRDIKPANIWLDANAGGRARILDFGLARPREQDQHLTQSGAILGTPTYMAPEQARGEQVDGRADLWSLGVVLYRLCSGRLPFRGVDTMSMLLAVATQEPPPLADLNPHLPPGLADLVMALLDKDPARRPPSAQEVVARITAIEKEQQAKASLMLSRPLQKNEKPESPSGPAVAVKLTQATNQGVHEPKSASIYCPECRVEIPIPNGATTVRCPLCAVIIRTEDMVMEVSGHQAEEVRSVVENMAATLLHREKPNTFQTQKEGQGKLRRPLLLGLAGAAALAVAAAVVLFLQTPHGTLRIEIDDPAIQVKVDAKGVVVQGADKHDLRLVPGPHLLQVQRGDLTFETDTFVLRKNETVTLRVEWLPAGKVRVLQGEKVLGERGMEKTARPGTAYALHFDGKARVGFFKLQLDRDSPLTIEMYAKLAKTSPDGDLAQFPFQAALTVMDGGWTWAFRNAADQIDRPGLVHALTDPKPPEVGKVVHLAGIRDGSTFRLFVDGKKVMERQVPDFRFPGIPPSFEFAQGPEWYLHQARISKSARYRDDFVPPKRFSRDKDTRALYLLDEGAGEVLTDSSGNGHHGKIVGAKWVKVEETDPDRRAARLLNPYAELVLQLDRNRTTKVPPGKPLPEEPFQVTSVFLPFEPGVSKDFAAKILLPALEDLRHLHTLRAAEAHIRLTDEELVRLASLPAAKTLTTLIMTFKVKEDNLRILQALPQLRNLGCEIPGNDTRAFELLRSLPRIEWFTWCGDDSIFTRKIGEKLASWQALALTAIDVNSVEPGALAALAKDSRWRDLDIYNAGLTDTHAAELSDFRNLVILKLQKNRLTDKSLEYIAGMKKLKDLHLQGNPVTEIGLRKLAAALPNCRIHWDGGVIEPKVAAADPDRRAAAWVLTQGGKVGIDGQAPQAKAVALPETPFRLTAVVLTKNKKVLPGGFSNFKGCTELTHLELSETTADDAALANFAGCRKLTLLDLGAAGMTDAGLAHFKACTDLKVLRLNRSQATETGLAHFAGCRNLQELDLSYTRCGNDRLEVLKNHPELKVHDLGVARVTDAGLANLKACRKLERLSLWQAKMFSDAGLVHLQALPRLTHLKLGGTLVGDPGLKHLQRCGTLLDLDLVGTRVTADGIDALKQALPACRIVWDGGTIEPQRTTLRPVE